MTYESLTLTLDDGVALLTLNDPERLNAVSLTMIIELNWVLEEIESASHVTCHVSSPAAGRASSGVGIDQPRL